jgi:Ran GTPase-activating protein (RanGAP) involved in mRNA processing and transport
MEDDDFNFLKDEDDLGILNGASDPKKSLNYVIDQLKKEEVDVNLNG